MWNTSILVKNYIKTSGYNMSSDKLIGPTLPPMFRRQGYNEDSDNERECKYKRQMLYFETRIEAIVSYIVGFLVHEFYD